MSDDLIDRGEVVMHLTKRLIECGKNNEGFVCDASYVFYDILCNRLPVWISEIPSAEQRDSTDMRERKEE